MTVKTHGIMFKAEMIRAYLDGRKSQTRRLRGLGVINVIPDSWKFIEISDGRAVFQRTSHLLPRGHQEFTDVRLPYGTIGDKLYFKETWAHDDLDCKDVKCGNRDHIWWRADEIKVVADSFAGAARWRSAMFMQQWASRVTVPITNVRVERLHDITGGDIQDEGISLKMLVDPYDDSEWLRQEYFRLWDSINGKKLPASKNPWLWVYEFPKHNTLEIEPITFQSVNDQMKKVVNHAKTS